MQSGVLNGKGHLVTLVSRLQGNIAWDEEYCMIDAKFRELVSEVHILHPGSPWSPTVIYGCSCCKQVMS